MDDFKQLLQKNFLSYASYVILDRAIPSAIDGLKPVQRRILWILKKIDDGKMHKVANVAGQTMALHPHGDKPIIDALINLANKGYLLDTQGNFGNLLTGDPASAARYIETRLSKLAKATLFNFDLTETTPSYDGRAEEPRFLPVKIPLLLMQGAEGIAVGMATKILPHNFVELLEAEISYLQGKPYEVFPDFPSGGTIDVSDYLEGKGKVKLRALIETVDDKTLVIREICYGTTTESLIRSIDEAAKKGKIKIEGISDYTSEKIEIEIRLPRGQYADQVKEQLFAFTDCEVTIHSSMIMILDELPIETTTTACIKDHADRLREYLKKELEIEKANLLEQIFQKSLEQIFIENRLYKKIEEIKSLEQIHQTVEKSLLTYLPQLSRIPTKEDQDRLLSIPLRRISRFDIEKFKKELVEIENGLEQIQKDLLNLKKFTIQYLRSLIKDFGSLFPRKTRMETLEIIDKKKVGTQKIRIGFDLTQGFLGTKITENSFECTSHSKILLLFNDATFKVISIPEKLYLFADKRRPVYIGEADKETVFNIIYTEKNNYPYVKRFIIKQFILEKEYQFLENEQKLQYFSELPVVVEVTFAKAARSKLNKLRIALAEFPIKSVKAKGIRIATKEFGKVKVIP